MLNATLCPSPIVPSTFSTGTAHVVEHQHRRRRAVEAELLFVRAAHHAHAALDDERGELLAVDLGEDGEQVGEAAVGDPRLLAVEHVVTRVGGSIAPWSSPTSASEPECGSVSA